MTTEFTREDWRKLEAKAYFLAQLAEHLGKTIERNEFRCFAEDCHLKVLEFDHHERTTPL